MYEVVRVIVKVSFVESTFVMLICILGMVTMLIVFPRELRVYGVVCILVMGEALMMVTVPLTIIWI